PAVLPRPANFAIQLPGNPGEQNTAGKREPDEGQQLGGDRREGEAEHDCAGNPPEDDFEAQVRRNLGRRHTDNNGIIPGENEVDHDDLNELNDLLAQGMHRISRSGNCSGMGEATGAPSSFADRDPKWLRASGRDGETVMTEPPS